jgi:hypothetical protein
MNNKKEEENFCSACIAAPLASAAVTINSASQENKSNDAENFEYISKFTVVVAFIVALLALCYNIYKRYISKCSSCRVVTE